MKKNIILILFLLFIFSLQTINAQIIIEGKQVKKSQNVQFEGTAIYVPTQSKIVTVSGSKTSFSLRVNNQTKYQFYYDTDHYEPPTYSIIIEPGMYELYPDLPPDLDSVFISITIEAIE